MRPPFNRNMWTNMIKRRYAGILVFTILGVLALLIITLPHREMNNGLHFFQTVTQYQSTHSDGATTTNMVRPWTYYRSTVRPQRVRPRNLSNVYDLNQPVDDTIPCRNMKTSPAAVICLYPKDKDIFVSGAFWRGAVYEKEQMLIFQGLLRQDPDLHVLDVGANLGQYSLLAAAMGRKAVAVEANLNTVHRIHKAVMLNRFQHNIIIVQNALSNTRSIQKITKSSINQGAVRVIPVNTNCGADCFPGNISSILMDDLVEVIHFKKAVMKIDCEGCEILAFQAASKLFDSVHIPYIIMELLPIKSKGIHVSAANMSAEAKMEGMTKELISFLDRRGYRPHAMSRKVRPLSSDWKKWPVQMLWKLTSG